MPPTDFCNCIYDVRATKPYGSRFLAGTETSISFLFLRTTPFIAEQWRAASRAFVRFADPGAGSSGYPVCPAAMSSRAPHHRRVSPSVRSED
jgi:hypothetical protein